MACLEDYKPSKTLLKSSLSSRFKEYPRVAALHGVAYVADPTRPKAERFGWLLCIVASTVATLGIIVTLMERFQTNPMMNSMELQFNDVQLELPLFYICPPWESFKNISPPEKYDHNFYKQLYEWDFRMSVRNSTYPTNLDNTVDLKKLFMRNAPSCDQFIHNSTLRTVADRQLNCIVSKVTVTTAGICFMFSPSGLIFEEIQVSFLVNITKFPTKIFATFEKDSKLLRHLQLIHLFFPVVLTTELQETYTSPDAKVLTRSQRKCFFPGEQSPYVKCVLNCRIANSLKFCHCVPWYLAMDDIKACPISKYECLDRNSPKMMDLTKCRCWQSCDNIAVTITKLEALSTEEPFTIDIGARAPLQYTRTVRYGLTDLFVSFGGIAGLFLGCSLLSLIEFGYYFSLRTYCGAVLNLPKRKHNVIKINVLDAVHPANLTKDRIRLALLKERVTFYDYVN